MGISGLLPALRSITERKTIDKYKGQTLAIDGYCWLHRAIYSCSQEICLGEGTDKYIVYFIDRVNALRQNGVTPFVVFDGGPLPMKKGTEEERRKAREKNRELGIQCYRQKNYSEARKYFVRAADVSPYMAHRVILRLRAMDVQYVVAPYEADAQLAFLMKNGLVDGVITEDSDCLPFGCSKVLFKMDRDGIAQEVQTANLKKNDGLSFHMFTDEMFLEMCIFSGCDYLPSLSGFGLKKAYALMKQHGTYTKILRALRMEGKVRVPPTYEGEFERALLTFHHQRVYDPRAKELVPLTPIPQELLDKDSAMDFLGPVIPHETAQLIAEGDMDPITCTLFTDHPVSRPHSLKAKATAPPPAMKTDRSGFIQRKSTPVVKSPPKATLPTRSPNRTLPAWMSRKASQLAAAKTTSPPVTSAPPASVTTTPKTISHFFAARAQKLSPSDESSKTSSSTTTALSRQQSTESTYESQDPNEVDVARSISFTPKNDESKHTSTGVYKENAAPNATKSSCNENAFARMMRAGSTQPSNSLKRKVPLSSSFHKSARLRGGVLSHQKPADRFRQLAFSQVTPEEKVDPSAHGTSSVVPSTPEPKPEGEVEPSVSDSQDHDNSQPCIARSTVLSERLNAKESDSVEQDSSAHKPTPRSPVDAFARFRFGAK